MNDKYYLILAGGVGAAKFIKGLANVIDPALLKIVINTGDDIELFGLKMCPDIDIITYTLANIVDKEKGWGFQNETFNCLSILKKYYGFEWFNAGDKDLATHIYRTDLFKKGFTFDSIRGDFSIDKGNAYTNNMVVKSPAGQIVIAGRIGLAEEDYDQTMTYTPTMSGSFAVAGAVAGGPLGAAIAVLTEKLFRKQISQVTQYQYTVTGPWDKPVIKQIKDEPPVNHKAKNAG